MPISKNKFFILNLNNYRNASWRTLHKAKKSYTALMSDQLKGLEPISKQVYIQYTVHPGTKAKCDIGNVCSIHQKFIEDSLTHYGILEDDDYTYIPITQFMFGSVIKGDPHVRVKIITK